MDFSDDTACAYNAQQELDVYRAALAASNSFVFIWDLNSDLITLFNVDDELSSMLMSNKPLSGKNWLARIHPDDNQQVIGANKQLIQGEQQHAHIKYRLLDNNGQWCWLSSHSRAYQYHTDGTISSIIGTGDTVSADTYQIDALKQKSARFNDAFKDTLDTVWDWDLSSDVVDISDSWKDLTGLELNNGHLLSKAWNSLIHPDDQQITQRSLRLLLSSETSSFSLEHRIRLNDGLYHWTLIRGHVSERQANGRATRITGILINIDRLKQQEDTLRIQQQTIALTMYSTASSLIEFDFIQQTFTLSSYTLKNAQTVLSTKTIPLSEAIAEIHPDDIKGLQEFISKTELGIGSKINEAKWRSKRQAEQYRWYQARTHVVERAKDGRATKAVGIRQDIDDSYALEYQHQLDYERELIAYSSSMHAVWELHPETGYVFFSSHLIDKLAPIGINFEWDHSFNYCLHCIHPEDAPLVEKELSEQIQNIGQAVNITYRFHSKSGDWVWVQAQGKVTKRDTDNKALVVIGTVIEITDLKRTEAELEKEKELAQTTLESINEAVITTDADGLISTLNHKAEQLLSISEDNAKGVSLNSICEINEENSVTSDYDPIQLCLQSDLAFNLNKLLLTNQSDKTFYIECSVSPLHTRDDEIIGSVLVIRDVSQSRKTTHEIEHRAQHDALTGIFNRHAFEAALEENTQAEKYQHTLCYIDLDQFKIVNDTCGHIAGDELLRQLTNELSTKIRQSDIFARLGGDEFGILMLNCKSDQAFKIAQNIKQTVSDYTFHWDDKAFKLGASIGLANINPEISTTLAMQHADTACFAAKDLGRNRVHTFNLDDEKTASTQGLMGWVPRIHNALNEDHFELYAQAITNLQNPSVHDNHFEILIRLNENGKTIPPGAFLPAAERYNLSSQIDRWVITNTMHALSTYRQLIKPDDMFNINLSAASLSEQGFLAFIKETLANSKTPASQICFEITETAAVTNLTAAHALISELKAMGCQFALDDFGSGLSSFGYLKNFPVDYLKIDGAFVKDLIDDPIDAAMVKSINEIGQIMGKKTVAEFVENQAIADVLTKLGVDYAQGYHFSVPSPLIEVLSQRKSIA